MHRKIIGVASGGALVLSILTLGVTSASATSASSVSCKSLSGNIATTIKVANCSPASTTYKTGSAKASAVTSGGSIKWAPSGKTTIISKPTVVSKGQGGCSAGQTEYDATAKVTGGTATYTKKGDAVKGRVCVDASGNLSLVKNTTFTL